MNVSVKDDLPPKLALPSYLSASFLQALVWLGVYALIYAAVFQIITLRKPRHCELINFITVVQDSYIKIRTAQSSR